MYKNLRIKNSFLSVVLPLLVVALTGGLPSAALAKKPIKPPTAVPKGTAAVLNGKIVLPGQHLGMCYQTMGAKFKISSASGAQWPFTSCSTKSAPKCISGFTPMVIGNAQMNTGARGTSSGVSKLSDKLDTYFVHYVCIKS